jgi:hypothetical protein
MAAMRASVSTTQTEWHIPAAREYDFTRCRIEARDVTIVDRSALRRGVEDVLILVALGRILDAFSGVLREGYLFPRRS